MAPLPPSPLPHLSLKKKQGNIAVIIHHQKHNSEGERGGRGGGRGGGEVCGGMRGKGREMEIKTRKGIINHKK